MTYAKHTLKKSHRCTERGIQRRDIREQLSECPQPCKVKAVKK